MKAWQGRFKGKTDPLMEEFSASIDFDRILYKYDIEGSKAHAQMLEKIGILTKEEKDLILNTLAEIREEIEKGIFLFCREREDIHMHIEARLIEKIGDVGKKLHTGRSRNDQVSLDMRMYVKDELGRVATFLRTLLKTLLKRAEKEKKVIMPGYTHMQRAQVVPFSHYLMAYYFMFKRDLEKITVAKESADVLPLGSGAIAGSTLPLDREFVRKKLRFSRLSENSMDSVSDRDFVLDTVFALTLTIIHMSRFAEDLIIFSTEEFSYISLPDKLCTGSSLMPQKKNPDALELIRGKAARVIGDLTSLLAILKGLPMTYNRDLQEDKEPLFHAMNTVRDSLPIITMCVEGLIVNRSTMEQAVRKSYLPATEIAEYLTLKGLPFREAHGIVGKLVRECEERGKILSELTTKELKKYHNLFEEDIFDYIDPLTILGKRKTTGGASFGEVQKTIEKEKLYIRS